MTPPAEGLDLRQLRQAVDASGEVIFLTDREGTITFVNREFERLYGYTAAEVVGRTTPRLLKGGASSADFYQSFWERLVAGEVVRGEFLNRAKDGRLVHVEVSANPIRDEHDQVVGFLGVQRDVTARKLVEAALYESEARYRTLAEAAHDSVFILDREGRLQYVNAHGAALMGQRPEDLAGRDLATIFPPDVAAAQRRQIACAIESRASAYAEMRIVLPTAEAWHGVWLTPIADETGAITSLVGIARDITEQHRLTDALERQNNLLGAIVESAPSGIAVLSGPDFTHGMVNAVLLQLLPAGTPVAGRPFADVWPSISDTLLPVFRRVMTSGCGERADVVLWRKTPGDAAPEPAYLTFAVGPIRVPGQESDSVLVIAMDTTARRQLEAQAEQAQKMEAVGRLAGGIAHEFNNLLTSVLGYADLVMGTLDARDPRRADLEEIRTAARTAATLSRQLLTLTLRRAQGAAPTPIDLNAAIGRMEPAIRKSAGGRAEVVLRLAPTLGRIAVEADQLEQVVTSLAANAGEAMPDGGRLDRSRPPTSRSPRRSTWRGGGCRRETYVELSVRDTGLGMPPDVRSHLFEPFFTTKPFGEGQGLSLSMVYGIVKASRGFVDVTSQPGEGSTFTLYFPAASGSAAPGGHQ